MHPVIQHINERREKAVPVNDGRKIVLVLFGGLMMGTRGAGAMIALEDLGLSDAFDEIYTISGGFANASYLLSKETRKGTSVYYEDLCSKKFFNPLRFWNFLNINYAINVVKEVKKLNIDKLFQNKTKLFVKLLNLSTGEYEYKNVKDFPPTTFLSIFKAAISIPYLSRGGVNLGGQLYKDSGLRWNVVPAFLRHITEGPATDILIIYNYSLQAKQVAKAGVQDSERVYQIIPEDIIKLNHFTRNSAKLKEAASLMEVQVKKLFI